MSLYVEDKSKIHFTTRIKSIIENNKGNGNYLILEKSYFNPSYFPMPSDKGYINGKKVVEVIVREGIVMHLVESYSGFTINMPVSCRIDLDNRNDYMIQDSAYHLLSNIIYENFNARTSLISIDKEKSEIYIDKFLNEDDIYSIENKSNEYIKKDYKIINKFRDDKKFGKQYIKIEDFEYIDCPYVHVDSLKEIQIIKIKESIRYNGGMKISYISGERLILFLRERDIIIKSLEKEFDTSLDEISFKARLLKEREEKYKIMYEDLLEEITCYLEKLYLEDYIVEKIGFQENLVIKLGEKLSINHNIIVFYNEETLKVYVFTNKNIKIENLIDDKNESYFEKTTKSNCTKIFFSNKLDLKRFISGIYDKILKYSKL